MRTTFKNRNGVAISVIVEGEGNNAGLAFVLHGLAGFKEQVHVRTMAEAFLENGYTVVTYDAANTIGESGGELELATFTNYYEDLEDIAEWAAGQTWYKEPFVVAGHSLGGGCAIKFAATHPTKLNGIVPVSAFISGKNYREGCDPEYLAEWKAKGYREENSVSRPGVVKRTSWKFVEDTDTHDLNEVADKIACPALFITGEFDEIASPRHQQELIDKIPDGAELAVIKGMDHNPRSPEHNAELKRLVADWVKKLA